MASKRIVVFNHKGGVSKTTSVYNLGWMLSEHHRVLLVDGDPQCNLSSLILGDNFEEYYEEDDTKFQNLKDGVESAFKARPKPIEAVTCKSPERAPNLFLLAGHADLSANDAPLTFAQTAGNAIATLQNLPGAFNELLRLTEEKYDIDYTIIDLNPSLSAINQNLFLSSDAFIMPTNPDPFSIMAINTLKETLPRWVEWKRANIDVYNDSAYPLSNTEPKFIGALIQRFNIRKGKAARPYRDNIAEIKHKISQDLIPVLERSGMALTPEQYTQPLIEDGYCLSEIPDFQGLLPKSYDAEVPVFALRDDEIRETGPVFDQMSEKRTRFNKQFEGIADEIVRLMQYA
ncbi:ParA family protein [uncultured Enterobacter sp.]|uniref:ParA family protein n=1 Tax=uncultured Enterobacter sp. TaxID=238202 RepID=UPI00260213F2|nr:ParA family protein [uncultured Enterobacter sp.]